MRNWRAVAALLALSGASFAYITNEILPIGLLHLISVDLITTPAVVGRLVSAYGVVVVLASVPLTVLVRRIPRRHLLSLLLVGFVAGSLVSALAPSYWLLLTSRLVVALTHAIFWSVVAVTAAGLFPPERRGRVLAILFAGSSLASVAGVPAGTWLGQQAGWRVAFWALTGLGLLALLTVAVALPTTRPEQSHAATAAYPDHRRYWLLVVTTALAVSGVFVAYTYLVPFATDAAGFSAAAVAPLLMVRGVAGTVGVALSGALLDRFPRSVMTGGVGLQAVALLGMYLLSGVPAVVVGAVALSGASMSALATGLTNRVLLVAPGSTDVAAAGSSTAFNVGITGGSFLGSLLLPHFGVASTALAGGLFSMVAVALLLSEPWLVRRRRSASEPEPAAGPLVPIGADRDAYPGSEATPAGPAG